MNRQRSPLRALAPLSLLAFAVALLLIVSNAGLGDSDNGSSKSSSTTERTTKREKAKQQTTEQQTTTERRRAKYKVKAGDTLAAIAERTGNTVERLLELNPNLDPNAMRAGQEICLEPSSDCGS